MPLATCILSVLMRDIKSEGVKMPVCVVSSSKHHSLSKPLHTYLCRLDEKVPMLQLHQMLILWSVICWLLICGLLNCYRQSSLQQR